MLKQIAPMSLAIKYLSFEYNINNNNNNVLIKERRYHIGAPGHHAHRLYTTNIHIHCTAI